MVNTTFPQPWLAADVANDLTWIIRLSPPEVQGFRDALSHATKHPKPLLEMTKNDFPLPPPSQLALKRAIDTTQGRWGMCLVKGFPTDEWTEADMRVAYWGMSLYMGVGRTQNRASEVGPSSRRQCGAERRSSMMCETRGSRTSPKADGDTTPTRGSISTKTHATLCVCSVAGPRKKAACPK